MKLTTTLWFFSYHPIKVKLYLGLKYYTCLLRGHVWAIKPPDCESPEIICVRLYSGQTYQKQYTCWVKVHVQWCWQNHNSVILLKHICVSQSFELNSIGFLFRVFVLCFCFCFCFCFYSVHHNWVGELLSSSEKQFGEQSQISLSYFINFIKVTKDQWYCVAAVLSSVHVLEYSLEQVWHRLFWTLLGLTNCSFLSVYLCACQLNFCARLKLLETQNGHRTATLCQIWN